MGIALALLVLGGIVIGGIALVRRVMDRRGTGAEGGADVLPYLLMALSVGVAVFSLASLAATAFPNEDLVIDVTGRVANSLAALVVSTPIAVFLWRRQEQRRASFPASAGWTVYLAIIEAVFTTALVIALFDVLEWILADSDGAGWTNLVVFGGVVVFHEWASRRTPPASDGAELPRVVGSAIGLIPTLIGLGGLLGWLLSEVYATLTPTAGGSDLGVWFSFLLAGSPVWYYRWLRPWPGVPAGPRKAWTFLVSVGGLASSLGSATVILILGILFLVTETEPAGSHFEPIPTTLTVAAVGAAVWAHHRQRLGRQRTDPVRAYEYSMTALGLLTGVGAATALASAAFGPEDLVDTRVDAVISVAITLLVGAGVWYVFWARASRFPREIEAASAPRRFYLIGLSVVLGLVSAGALIATLVILFQRLLESGDGDTIVVSFSLFVFAGLGMWHLLRVNGEDRDLIGREETISPFNVTIICSHPGMVAAQFPSAAKVRVLYRGDDMGNIDEAMAQEIVETVGHTSSLVWVDADGFRVAASRE